MDVVTLALAKKYIKEAGGGGGSLPAGVIVMWSGAVNAIPEGWALCDGENGTPDLRGRFVLGNSASHAIGSKGGSETVTLTVNNLPEHTHKLSIPLTSGSGSSNTMLPAGGSNRIGEYVSRVTGLMNSLGGDVTPKNQSFSIMPPYYTLAYIMKL